MRTPEDYEAEIKLLKAELERLRGGGALMTMAGAHPLSGPVENFTIQGLEEHILVVDEKDRLAYLNDRMAQLLGIPLEKRRAMLGSPLSDWARGPLGDVLTTLISAVRQTGQSYVIERQFPDLEPERLPSWAERRVNEPPLLRFACSSIKDKVQIVAQDVTHTTWLSRTFSRYVSASVIDRMRQLSEEELMRTERKTASILFADLRGFTRLCQEWEPEKVVEMVNTFFSHAMEAVEHFDGMVDKFVGDEIMALFGVPLPAPDHALRALMTADRIVKTHAQWAEEMKEKGVIIPGVGVGVTTGEVIVGNIGTSSRLDYTVLGHNVNLAARLCASAAPGEILTVKATHQAAREALPLYKGPDPVPRFRFKAQGVLELKNILKPVEVIAVST